MPLPPTTGVLIDSDPLNVGNRPGDGPLRAGGRTPGVAVTREANLPSTYSKAANAQSAATELVRDLWGGSTVVRSRGEEYLPKAEGEELTNYNSRLKRSVFFNAYRRSVEGLVGLIFRKDPRLGTDVPSQIVGHWENIDQAGTHGAVFARELEQDAMITGHAGILVEFPKTGGEQTRADELPGREAVRPYWVPIRKEDIVSWRTETVNGETVLSQLVLREVSMVPDGAFGEREQTRWRVLQRQPEGVVWALLEITKERTVVTVDQGVYTTQREIPFVEVATSGRRSLLVSDPPLIDLAHLNVAHYQQWSDAAHSRYMSCVPFLMVTGMKLEDEDGKPIVVGPNAGISTTEPNAKAEWVAHSGTSLEDCRKALEDIKSDMGTMGVAMLAPQKRTAETAEAKRIDKATTDSALSVTARSLQDALERALGFHARYLGLDSGGSVEVNRDFEGLLMSAQEMVAFASLVREGLPWEAALEQLQRGGRIDEDEDILALAEVIQAGRAADRMELQERFGSLVEVQ